MNTLSERTWVNDGRDGLDCEPVLGEGLVVQLGDEGDVDWPLARVGHYQPPRLRHQETHILEPELDRGTVTLMVSILTHIHTLSTHTQTHLQLLCASTLHMHTYIHKCHYMHST